MALTTFDDGQTVQADDIVDWCDEIFDLKGRKVILVRLSGADPVVILDKRANRKVLPARPKHKALLTFDDGQTAYADDVLEWIAGHVDWVGNPVLSVFFGHAKPMVISDNEFNRALLSQVQERWAGQPVAPHASGCRPQGRPVSAP